MEKQPASRGVIVVAVRRRLGPGHGPFPPTFDALCHAPWTDVARFPSRHHLVLLPHTANRRTPLISHDDNFIEAYGSSRNILEAHPDTLVKPEHFRVAPGLTGLTWGLTLICFSSATVAQLQLVAVKWSRC